MSFVTVRTFAPGRYAEGGVPWECMYERAGSQKALRRGYCRFRFRAVRHAAHAELGPPCRRSGQLLIKIDALRERGVPLFGQREVRHAATRGES